MSEEHDIFEEMFKDSLQDIEIPVSEGLWKRIKISIWGRRKYFFLLWFFIGIIALSIGAFLFGGMKNENDKTNIVAKHLTTKITTGNAEVNKSNDIDSQNTILKNNGAQKTNQITSDSTDNYKNETANNSEGISTVSEKIKSNNKANVTSKKSIKENKIDYTSINSTTKSKSTIQENKTNELPATSTIANKSKNLEVKIDSNTIVLSKAIVSNDSIPFTDSIKISQKDTIGLIVKNNSDSLPKLDSLKEDKSETNKSRFFFSADGGALFPSIKYNAVNPILTNSINNSTKSTINYNFNVQLGCSISKKVNILAGLGFIKYKNEYNYSTTFATKDTITDFYLDSLGNPQYYSYIKDTTKTIQLSEKHQFRYLTIPINAEYLFKLGTRFKLITSMGLILHQQIKSEIAWIDPESNKAIFKNNSDHKAFFASLSGGLKLEYEINKHWGVNLSGTYIHSLTDLNKTYENVKVRPNAINANVGLRYYIFSKK
jgi:hypothetical protein